MFAASSETEHQDIVKNMTGLGLHVTIHPQVIRWSRAKICHQHVSELYVRPLIN